jgi:hypothetical protein
MVRVMSDIAALTKLFSDFIADEAAAFPNEQGGFWPSNHHRIKPALAKVPVCLSPEDRVLFYFHYLRVSTRVPQVSQTELPYLIAAYKALLPTIDQLYPNLANRLDTLFAFGFDDEGTLPSGETTTAAELKEHVNTLAQTTKYASLPAQREKRDRFKPYDSEAPRILETFRRLDYQHDRRHRDYTSTNLTFWGLALIALQNPTTRTALIRDMLDGPYDIPERPNYLTILSQTAQSVLPGADSDPEFQHEAARLQEVTKNNQPSV